MSETKRQKSNDLQPGKNIWSTLKSWFGNVLDEGTNFFCPWPLSNEQLEFHLVEGDVKKVGKRKATVLYSAMSDVEVILDKKEISMQSHNFFDHDEFPTGAVVVKTQNDLDYVAGVAPCRPKINRECSHAHELNSSYCVNCYQLQYNTFIEREHHLKKRLDTLYEESLMYKRSGLEHIPEITLIDQFPEVIKVCVHDRTDIAASQKNDLEEDRQVLVARLSFKSEVCNPWEDFKSMRIDMIEQLSQQLSYKKLNGNVEVECSIPMRMINSILLPFLRLTNEWKPERTKQSKERDGETRKHLFFYL